MRFYLTYLTAALALLIINLNNPITNSYDANYHYRVRLDQNYNNINNHSDDGGNSGNSGYYPLIW